MFRSHPKQNITVKCSFAQRHSAHQSERSLAQSRNQDKNRTTDREKYNSIRCGSITNHFGVRKMVTGKYIFVWICISVSWKFSSINEWQVACGLEAIHDAIAEERISIAVIDIVYSKCDVEGENRTRVSDFGNSGSRSWMGATRCRPSTWMLSVSSNYSQYKIISFCICELNREQCQTNWTQSNLRASKKKLFEFE